MKLKSKNLPVLSIDGISKLWYTSLDKHYTRELYNDSHPEMGANLPIRVDFVHEEYCYEKYYRRREHSEVFSIELVLEGSMLFSQRGKSYRVMPGEVFLVQFDQENEFSTGPEKHCHRLACSLTGKSLNNILHVLGLFELDVIKLQDISISEKLMRCCLNEFRNLTPQFRYRTSTLSYELLLELSKNINRKKQPELLNRAVEIMEHHLAQRLTLNQLAKLLGTSRSTLSRLFYNQFQKAPINYFIHLKMKTAQSLLTNSNLQIQEISRQVGYESPLYFSSEFKKRVGLSPRKFRNRFSACEK